MQQNVCTVGKKKSEKKTKMASVGSDEWRAVCDKFTNAQHLTDVESRNDPENNPFLSKYKAREVLREIHCSLKSFEAGDSEEEVCGESPESGVQRPSEPPVERPSEDVFVLGFSGDSPAGLRAARLGAVEYYLGVNHVDTEELSAGQEHLMNCMKLLGRCRVSPENVSLFIHVRVPSTSSFFLWLHVFTFIRQKRHILFPSRSCAGEMMSFRLIALFLRVCVVRTNWASSGPAATRRRLPRAS